MRTHHPGIALMRLLAPLPLPCLRALGAALGGLLYLLAASRRRVVMTNLALCFPQRPKADRQRLARRVFVCFGQAWLDRAWLWHGAPERIRPRFTLTGALDELAGEAPTVLFAPHFVGLDAGATALSLRVPRRWSTIYTPQSNAAIDAWIHQGRRRFGQVRLYERIDGVKAIVRGLREGEVLYLLPDMNFGTEESIFVPFYGVPAATVPSLSRFARLARAKVVPVVTRLTRTGYEVCVLPAWRAFPSGDAAADTARMNRELQTYIDAMPEQYFWVHKRFKSRPKGTPAVY